MEKTLFALGFIAYTVSMSLFIGYALTRRENLARVARCVLGTGLIFHIISILIRTVIARQMPQHGWYVPWSNWFESFSFFAIVIVLEFLIIQWGR